jgi:hypothetical protein
MKARTQMTIALASAALVLAVMMTIAPQASMVTNEGSIDVFAITMNAKDLPVQQYAAH